MNMMHAWMIEGKFGALTTVRAYSLDGVVRFSFTLPVTLSSQVTTLCLQKWEEMVRSPKRRLGSFSQQRARDFIISLTNL
jgi:hypothetical protein